LQIDEHLWWVEREQLGPVQRFTEFLEEVVLKEVSGRIVIFIDEIDSTLVLPFTDDFFLAIRALYEGRSSNPENRRLTFVLIGVARPADLIKDRRRRPYNIGRTVDLQDFSAENARTFLPGLEMASTNQPETILERILHWTGGHPYLTQKVCATIVEEGGDGWSDEQVDQLVAHLFFQERLMRVETNLQWISDYIHKCELREGMLQIYQNILSGKQVKDEERSIEKSQLKLSGLVKTMPEGYLQVRNQIYQYVFGPEWVEQMGAERVERFPSGIQWQKMGVPALVVLLVAVLALTIGLWGRWEGTPTPTLGVSPSPTSTQKVTVISTPTPLPPTKTEALTSTSVPVVTPTEMGMPTPTATLTSVPTSTGTPTLTAAHTFTPVPMDTYTLMVPPTPAVPKPGSFITATSAAAIYVGPDTDSEIMGLVGVGESVKVIGRVSWGRWVYVHSDQEGVEGFVWGPYFGWQEKEAWESLPIISTPTPTSTPTFEPLVVLQAGSMAFCTDEGGKMAGVQVFVRGGDGNYTFFWEDREVSTTKLQEAGGYLVFWSWGSFSQVGTVTVVSGDGQRASQGDIWLSEPTCSS
jgi:hypothetical protein